MCFAPSRPKRDVVILGLTGAIGAGKSVAARMFLYEGAAVFDADAAVRGLIGSGGVAVAAVETAFPGCGEDGPGGRGIDRAALARRVFGDGEATDRLENILHPLVHEAEVGFLCRAAARRARLAVLEVPLLFETGGDRRCDAVAVVWAPAFVRARRVLKRPGMTPKLFGGAGVYADVKFTTSSPGSDPYYLSDITVLQAEATFGDRFLWEQSDWLSINFALVYALSRELAVYGGAGYTRERRYRQYFDDSESRGQLGFYWVSDSAASGNRVNVLGGAFFRLGQAVMLQTGVEAQPTGATVGVMFFPF